MRNIAKDIMEIKDKFIKYCDNEKKIYKKLKLKIKIIFLNWFLNYLSLKYKLIRKYTKFIKISKKGEIRIINILTLYEEEKVWNIF